MYLRCIFHILFGIVIISKVYVFIDIRNWIRDFEKWFAGIDYTLKCCWFSKISELLPVEKKKK